MSVVINKNSISFKFFFNFSSYMDTEKFECAVADYEKVCKLDKTKGRMNN